MLVLDVSIHGLITAKARFTSSNEISSHVVLLNITCKDVLVEMNTKSTICDIIIMMLINCMLSSKFFKAVHCMFIAVFCEDTTTRYIAIAHMFCIKIE